MSRARNATLPNERGYYRVWCDACDAEGEFPTVAMAIAARREHLCEGEVPSCSWPGWQHEPEVSEENPDVGVAPDGIG